MSTLRQVFLAIMIALASLVFILGGFLISLTEGNLTNAQSSTQTLLPTLSPTLPPFTPSAITLTASASLTASPSFTMTPSLLASKTSTPTPSLSPSPTYCPVPLSWLPYTVLSGDTLDGISAIHRITTYELQQANCLPTTELLPGDLIYVPPAPTRTPVPCGRPYNWIIYYVQPGDTLYRLSTAYGITVADLQRANCMGHSTLLQAGQTLYVPPWAPLLPSPTFPFFDTFTPIPTDTPFTGQPTDTPGGLTETPFLPTESIPTATEPPVIVPTETWTPTSSW